MIIWQYSDDLLTIQLQHFDDILTIFWHCHVRSLSSFFALLIVICAESFQMLLWPIFLAKITQNARPLFWVVVLVVPVDCPHVDAKFSKFMKYISSHVHTEQFSAYLCQKSKKACSLNIRPFSLMPWLAAGLMRVDSMSRTWHFEVDLDVVRPIRSGCYCGRGTTLWCRNPLLGPNIFTSHFLM